ncbi:vWA domain-containing protein [Nocardioides sp.]|uniref:vWA domain-containing protein n=1 Tax=Nocardioides sp. TaxID=35761 RepID=UPI002734ADE0|nr:vWA domain-containing protein [Nocardioides sp.]MDP3889909.1 vWA domain-containing protein [Nocardioides sp.]
MHHRTQRVIRRSGPVGLLATGALALATASAVALPGVTPATYATELAPGESVTITKTVETPPIPPNPDIVLMADTTGSMGPSIGNVRTNAAAIVGQVQAAQPTAQFAVAEYKDTVDGPSNVYRVNQQLTASSSDVQTGINQWSASGGGDLPEAWIGALGRIPTTIDFRPDGTRVVVMFGDAPSHDPSLGFTLATATAGLQAADVRVIAISVPGGPGLDATGQATHVTSQTGGALAAADPDQVSAEILSQLENLAAEVTHEVSCDPGVSATLDPASATVTSGQSVDFEETITLAADAPQGETVSCEVRFLVNGSLPGPEFVQTIDIDVLDVTPPTVACTESSNPGGNVPKAGGTLPNPQGQNQDGFYRLDATDLVDPDPAVYLRDTGSGHVFGPYADGQQIKYTQAASGPSEKPLGGSGILHLTGTGDGELFAEDSSGNVSDPVACLVPAPPM